MDLKVARVLNGKTQWDVRKVTGIHQSKVSLIENGYVIPTNDEKKLIAGVLGFQVNEIEWPSSVQKSKVLGGV